MFKKVYTLVSIYVLAVNCYAQNIVPNGDFEDYNYLPNDVAQWMYCNNWTNAGGTATPDYYNTAGSSGAQLPNTMFGTVTPYSGNAIMGFATFGGNFDPEYREYIMVQFSTPMVIGNSYQITFNLTNGASNIMNVYSSNHVGIRFSNSPLSQTVAAPINVVPQLEIPGQVWSNTWQQYTLTFIADAAYTYMTLGNFYNDASTTVVPQNMSGMNPYAYYFIDKVEVIGESGPPAATISGTTTICNGGTAVVGFNGTPNALVTYSVDGGSNQTILLDNNGTASLTTNSLSVGETYTLVSVELTTSPFTSQTVTGSAVITVENPPVLSFTPDVTSGCAPLTVVFTSQSTDAVNCTWDFGDQSNNIQGCGMISHIYTTGGVYDVTLNATSANGCPTSLTMPALITVFDSPNASFTSSASEGFSSSNVITFTNLSTDADSYTWDFGDNQTSTETSPEHDYSASSLSNFTVTLIAYGTNGCTDEATQEIKTNELIFYVPNTFTPDGNDHNQIFQPVFTSGFDKRDYKLLIFNRWGEQVFETNDITQGWDGTDHGTVQSDGVYIWNIVFKVSASDEKKTAVGHLNLIR